MKYLINSLFLILLLTLFGCKQGDSTKKIYPEFTFKTLSGKKITLSKQKNKLEIKDQHKPVLFFMIQAECDECFGGIEHIQRIYEDYKEEITFIPILIDTHEGLEILKQEALTLQRKYHLAFEFYYATNAIEFLQSFQPQTNTPFLVLYDEKLQKVREYEGFIPEEMIEFEINQVLQTMQESEDKE